MAVVLYSLDVPLPEKVDGIILGSVTEGRRWQPLWELTKSQPVSSVKIPVSENKMV